MVSNEQLKILDVLRFHKGPQAAISNRELARRVAMEPRRVQLLIQDMIINHGLAIASSCRKPYGYFIPQDRDEFMAYRNQLVSRIRETAKRLNAFDKILAQKIGQMLQEELF